MGGAQKHVPADLLPFVGEDQLEATQNFHTETQTRGGSSSSCRNHLQRGHTPTRRRPSVFAFLRRIWNCGKTSNIDAPRLQMCYTRKKTHSCHAAVMTAGALSAPPVVPGPPLYSRKEQLPWIHTRRKQRISTLNCTRRTNDPLTCTHAT